MYGRNLIIERADAETIQEGQKVTLMKWGNATISRKVVNGDSKLSFRRKSGTKTMIEI